MRFLQVLCIMLCALVLAACGQKTESVGKQEVDLSGKGPTREELLAENLPIIALIRLVDDIDATIIIGNTHSLVVQLFSKDEAGTVMVLAEKTFRGVPIPFPVKVQFDVPIESVNPAYSYFITAYMTDGKVVWENAEHAGVITQANKLTTYIKLSGRNL